MKYPKPLQDLVDSFSKFPGIGKKTAERLAMFTIADLSKEDVSLFQERLGASVDSLHPCKECGLITDAELCQVCSDASRDHSTLMVVEESKDVFVMESMGFYQGKYHVLQGTIAPLKKKGPDEITLRQLIERLKEPNYKELILALNSSVDGETTSLYIQRLLKDTDLSITQLAQGIPAGGDLQYADEITLKRALEGRRKLGA